MLSHPRGFRRSINVHNINDAAFLDWLQATILFVEEEFSQTDVIDYLLEEQLYDDQDFASGLVLGGWTNLERQLSWLGDYSPIGFTDRRMVRQLIWTEVPAYSYCLAVSLGPRYEGWSSQFDHDYTEQGRLFELITKAAMKVQFDGWRFLHTGWRRDNASKLPAVVQNLISTIDERTGNLAGYTSDNANEAGVDLVWHLPFADHRGSAPVYLAQCASGMDWVGKVHLPSIPQWTKIVDFALRPNKAFSLPFALSDKELRQYSNMAEGLLIDRCRLLARNHPEEQWVPEKLRNVLVKWLEPKINWITSR